MKHPHLPKYFAIKCDENNPLWEEYIQWVISESGDTFWRFEYVGFDGSEFDNGFNAAREPDNFTNTVTIITLEEWKQAIDKTEDDILDAMIEYANQFKPKWISVSNRLPEIDFNQYWRSEIPFYVIAEGLVRCAYWTSIGWQFVEMSSADFQHDLRQDSVTEWLDLPLPTKP